MRKTKGTTKNKRKNIEERHNRELRRMLLFVVKVEQLLGSLSNYKFNYKSSEEKLFCYIKGVLETQE